MSGSESRPVFSKKFRLGTIIYALVFIAASAAALLILWEYLKAYERSQTRPVVDNYVLSLTPDQVTDVLLSDVSMSGFEDARSIIREDYAVPFCEGEKSCVRDIGGPDDGSITYMVYGGNRKLMRIVLRAEKGGAGFGRNLWSVSETAPAEGWQTRSYSIQCAVPEKARLTLNGREVNADNAVLNSIVYPLLRPSEQHIFGNFTVYRVSGLLRKPEVAVISEEGTRLTESSTIDNLTYYLPFGPEFHSVTVKAPRKAEIYIGGYLQEPERTPETFYYSTGEYEPEGSEAASGQTYVFGGFIGTPDVEATLAGKRLELEKPDENTYIFSYPESELYTLTLSVPRGAEIRLWGKEIAEELEYAAIPGISFNKIDKYIDRLPVQGGCSLTGFYERPDITVTFNGQKLEPDVSENGSELTYTYDWPRTEPDNDRKKAVLDMTEAYLTYVSQGRKNLDDNYSRVLGLMVSGSDARSRIAETYDSYYWVNGYKETLERSIDIVSFTPYGDDLFEATVSFYIHTIRSSHEVESSGSIRMVFVRTGSGWRAGTFDLTG